MSTPLPMHVNWKPFPPVAPTGSIPLEQVMIHRVDFDVRVKRKMGKSDNLMLVRFFPGQGLHDSENLFFEHRMIRCLTKN